MRIAISKKMITSNRSRMQGQAGIEVLKSGGNAADAIAVIQFMLGVVQPQSTGIGGGCFVLLFNRCHS